MSCTHYSADGVHTRSILCNTCTCPLHLSSFPFPPLQLPDSIYLVTEEVVPLEEHRSTQDGRSEFSTAWGLHQVLVREEGEGGREEGEERGGGGGGGR